MAKRAKITDCGDGGCGECDVCKRLDFLEWCAMVAPNSIPSTIEAAPEIDAYIEQKYGMKP